MKWVVKGWELRFLSKVSLEEGGPVGPPGGIAISYATDEERRLAAKDNLAPCKLFHNKVY